MREPKPAQLATGRYDGGVAMVMAVVWLICSPILVYAAERPSKPLWELGVAGGVGWLPDYPAADENHVVGLVIPYFVYRGKIFRAGDEGVARGRFLRGDRHELDISISGSFPTDSSNNDARRGMPDLDFLFEVGPRLKLTLAEVGRQAKIGLELPVRVVFSVALDAVGYRGVLFHPRLAYSRHNLFGTGIGLKVTGGPIFATNALMDYFYKVGRRFATPRRPVFEAEAGYLGTVFTFIFRRQISRHVDLLGAARVGYFEAATNADSPLFRSQVNLGLGLGFTWSMVRSQRRITD